MYDIYIYIIYPQYNPITLILVEWVQKPWVGATRMERLLATLPSNSPPRPKLAGTHLRRRVYGVLQKTGYIIVHSGLYEVRDMYTYIWVFRDYMQLRF